MVLSLFCGVCTYGLVGGGWNEMAGGLDDLLATGLDPVHFNIEM